ncbi:MAG: thioredoxin domain-containing protein [Gemmatimonadaceae bacterium]|nr:thioredoxin domain-containing protein [Gemmatimonadaceae bacterium]
MIEFSDLECPFCRAFHETLEPVARKLGSRLHHEFMHFPIPAHRLAMPAARAVECARAQDRATAMVDVLFALQDSLGVKPWADLADSADVSSPGELFECFRDPTPVARIERDIALGQKLGVRGTPTVIVNGWRFAGTPREPLFSQTISYLLEGKDPFPKRLSHAP